MRNNFTFRSRTETYFTHLSPQPLMILILPFIVKSTFLTLEPFEKVKHFVFAQTSCFFDSTKSNQRIKGVGAPFIRCARIYSYTGTFFFVTSFSDKIMQRIVQRIVFQIRDKNFAETLRFSGSVLFFIDCRNLIDLLIFLIGNTKMLITSPKIYIFWCGFFYSFTIFFGQLNN